MTKIINNHDTDLRLPRGVTLRPGVAVEIPNWAVVKNHSVVKIWVDAGILAEVDGEGGEDAEGGAPLSSHDGSGSGEGEGEGEKDPVSEIDLLKAKAKELGLVVRWNTSEEKLREMIAEAEAK